VYGYKVIRTFDHDETAFTEGLVTADGLLYESEEIGDTQIVQLFELGQTRVGH